MPTRLTATAIPTMAPLLSPPLKVGACGVNVGTAIAVLEDGTELEGEI